MDVDWVTGDTSEVVHLASLRPVDTDCARPQVFLSSTAARPGLPATTATTTTTTSQTTRYATQ